MRAVFSMRQKLVFYKLLLYAENVFWKYQCRIRFEYKTTTNPMHILWQIFEMFYKYNMNTHHLLTDFMAYVIAGMWWKCVERWKVFRIPKKIKAILKYYKNTGKSLKISELRMCEPSMYSVWKNCLMDDLWVRNARQIMIWTDVMTTATEAASLFGIVRLLDRSVFTDISKEATVTVNTCRLCQSNTKLFTALQKSASQKPWFFISTAARNFIFTRL